MYVYIKTHMEESVSKITWRVQLKVEQTDRQTDRRTAACQLSPSTHTFIFGFNSFTLGVTFCLSVWEAGEVEGGDDSL